ncbi:hypothetical protein [Streptomyces sp. ALI-76-A]|uniref:hypothetical protein n=1 Tax=Streptomyces sp. ALI-76-A TaxID=3025736 RepID=UPI00256F366E|nr:hypothetical protein [Streptomyces sp. ALI-76-A]MDL5199613.1 hypothetical protein [Streptomyces sp. ALI-76-A]
MEKQTRCAQTLERSDLQASIRAALANRERQVIVFLGPNEVAVGSTGHFSPSGHSATRRPYDWIPHDVSFTPRDGEVFTSHHGPANDEKLVEVLVAALVTECSTPGESDLPHGLCGDKADHQPNSYISGSLGEFQLPYAPEIQQRPHPDTKEQARP